MKLTTKGDIVRIALRKATLASNATLTDTDPQSVEDALDDFELMMAEWLTDDAGRGINPGFLFSESGVAPLPDDLHGLPDYAINAAILTLTTRIITDYGQEPSITLVNKAAYAKERVIKALARQRIPRLHYPARMPVGSGNHLTCRKFYAGVKKHGGDPNTDN